MRDSAIGQIAWIVFSVIAGFLVWAFVSNQETLPYKIYLVQSGSMEPSIKVGDVIVISKSDTYQVNDVVTFQDSENRRVTHRVTEKKNSNGRVIYTTKGDANRDDDRELVDEISISGSVQLTIPRLGYLVNFLKTTTGFGILIIIPAVVIVLGEVKNIFKNSKDGK